MLDVNLKDGSYKIHTTETNLDLFGLTFGQVNGVAKIVGSTVDGQIYILDPISFTSQPLSTNTTPDASNIIGFNTDMVYDKKNHRYLVPSEDATAVIAVDGTSGARTIFSSNVVGTLRRA